MAKVSPVSIKYMIHASFIAEGALEKPDIIGALFGQTEGLLGNELEMRELQKEGKIGRIEVQLQRVDKRTEGNIQIPTALDQSETTLVAAAVETIERIGPSDAQIEIEKIEDVRGTKRDYILERAKKLMQQIQGSSDSREISNTIKSSIRTSQIQEYGDEKLPCGDLSGDEVIVVEGRADVVNLLRAGVNNVIAMNGTKLPEAVRELSKKKTVTLFVDGDRGGKLITQNVLANASVNYIANAPDGKEVEELTSKEILMALRKKVPAEGASSNFSEKREIEKIDLTEEIKEKLRNLFGSNQGSNKTIILDSNLNEIKDISTRSLTSFLRRMRENPSILLIDGSVTRSIIEAAEEKGVSIIAANKFSTTDTKIELLSF